MEKIEFKEDMIFTFYSFEEVNNFVLEYNLVPIKERLDTFEMKRYDQVLREAAKLEVPQFSKLIPLIVLRVHEVNEGNATYYTNTRAMLSIDSKVYSIVESKKGMYVLYPFNEKKYTYRPDYQTERKIEELPKPNMVGVATKNKLAKWVEYWDRVDALKEEHDKLTTEKVDEFINKIKSSGLNVRWFNEKSGEAYRGGIKYEFNIQPDGFIEEIISISCRVQENLDNFILISDNNVIEPESYGELKVKNKNGL